MFFLGPFGGDISNSPSIERNNHINIPENIPSVDSIKNNEKNIENNKQKENYNNKDKKEEIKGKINKVKEEINIGSNKKVRSWKLLILVFGFLCMISYKIKDE